MFILFLQWHSSSPQSSYIAKTFLKFCSLDLVSIIIQCRTVSENTDMLWIITISKNKASIHVVHFRIWLQDYIVVTGSQFWCYTFMREKYLSQSQLDWMISWYFTRNYLKFTHQNPNTQDCFICCWGIESFVCLFSSFQRFKQWWY